MCQISKLLFLLHEVSWFGKVGKGRRYKYFLCLQVIEASTRQTGCWKEYLIFPFHTHSGDTDGANHKMSIASLSFQVSLGDIGRFWWQLCSFFPFGMGFHFSVAWWAPSESKAMLVDCDVFKAISRMKDFFKGVDLSFKGMDILRANHQSLRNYERIISFILKFEQLNFLIFIFQ